MHGAGDAFMSVISAVYIAFCGTSDLDRLFTRLCFISLFSELVIGPLTVYQADICCPSSQS